MDFAYDAETIRWSEELNEFMDTHVLPAEPVLRDQMERREHGWGAPPIIADLQDAAKQRGLWNLFLSHSGHGAGLTNVQYAPLAEITGRSPGLAPVALNCAAPDTGNIELLASFGTPSQQKEWLRPLLDGEIRSGFAMTEPDSASSDARTISTAIRRDGDEYVISGQKWFVTGALNPKCAFFIVMGKTCFDGAQDRQQSMIIVPRDSAGVEIGRGMTVFGYDDADHGGHAEVAFHHVRVPVEDLLGEEGAGFAMAQARLGPGRIHHCMRLIGMAERAIDTICERSTGRLAFGRPLSDQGVVRDWLAESRIRIEQARLLVLKAAWAMDTYGTEAAHRDIQLIKAAVPRAVEWVLDKAIQVHGASGVSQDTPLAFLWAQARALRIADGPDEVHKRSLARRELAAMNK